MNQLKKRSITIPIPTTKSNTITAIAATNELMEEFATCANEECKKREETNKMMFVDEDKDGNFIYLCQECSIKVEMAMMEMVMGQPAEDENQP